MPTIYKFDDREKRNIKTGLATKKVFITDIRGVKGMEFNKVIIMLRSSEYYLSPYIMESLSRSIDYILLFSKLDQMILQAFSQLHLMLSGNWKMVAM